MCRELLTCARSHYEEVVGGMSQFRECVFVQTGCDSDEPGCWSQSKLNDTTFHRLTCDVMHELTLFNEFSTAQQPDNSGRRRWSNYWKFKVVISREKRSKFHFVANLCTLVLLFILVVLVLDLWSHFRLLSGLMGQLGRWRLWWKSEPFIGRGSPQPRSHAVPTKLKLRRH